MTADGGITIRTGVVLRPATAVEPDKARPVAVRRSTPAPAVVEAGGWETEQLPRWSGGVLALVVTLLGGLASLATAYLVGLWPYGLYLALVGIVLFGLAGMTWAWHHPPAELDGLAR